MLLTVQQVAAALQVPQRRVYEMIRLGLLPAVHLGRQVRISQAALDSFIAGGGRQFAGGWRKAPADDTRTAEMR